VKCWKCGNEEGFKKADVKKSLWICPKCNAMFTKRDIAEREFKTEIAKLKTELAEAKEFWQKNFELQTNAYKLLEEANEKIIVADGKMLKIIIPDGTIIDMNEVKTIFHEGNQIVITMKL
jgi:ribosomal protein L37AE/L43A